MKLGFVIVIFNVNEIIHFFVAFTICLLCLFLFAPLYKENIFRFCTFLSYNKYIHLNIVQQSQQFLNKNKYRYIYKIYIYICTHEISSILHNRINLKKQFINHWRLKS